MDDGNDTRTKLLTLLNVSHLKSTKRKLKENPAAVESFEIPREKRIKLNQRRKVVLADPAVEKGEDDEQSAELAESKEQAVVDEAEVQLEIGGENLDGKHRASVVQNVHNSLYVFRWPWERNHRSFHIALRDEIHPFIRVLSQRSGWWPLETEPIETNGDPSLWSYSCGCGTSHFRG